jgi:hypothetical protein
MKFTRKPPTKSRITCPCHTSKHNDGRQSRYLLQWIQLNYHTLIQLRRLRRQSSNLWRINTKLDNPCISAKASFKARINEFTEWCALTLPLRILRLQKWKDNETLRIIYGSRNALEEKPETLVEAISSTSSCVSSFQRWDDDPEGTMRNLWG